MHVSDTGKNIFFVIDMKLLIWQNLENLQKRLKDASSVIDNSAKND